MDVCLQIKYPLFFSDFNEICVYSTDFRKILMYQTSWDFFLWETNCSIHTDREIDMTKLIIAFWNFANAPKNEPRPDRITIYDAGNIRGENRNRLLKLLAAEGVRLNSDIVTLYCMGDRGGTVVKVLCYKSEGCWFEPRWCHWNFSWHNPSDPTMALETTQPLTEMSTRRISWG